MLTNTISGNAAQQFSRANTGQLVDDVRTKDVERELGELDAATQHARNLADQLTIRLQSVITPRDRANKCETLPDTMICPLAHLIREQRRKVEHTCRDLTELLEIIEL